MSDGLVDVVVPKWGMTMDTATVSSWLKEVGEDVALDEAVVELETDKVVNEVASQAAGVLVEQLAEVGAEVEPGDVIARVRPAGA